MYELFITIGRFTYNYGLFEAEFIDQAKEDLQKHFPHGKVFAIEKEVNTLRLDSDMDEVINYF
jgi:hypothetical protein